MSEHDETASRPGARPLGPLAEADPSTRLFVWTLRHWLDGVWSQQIVWSHFAARLGARDGRRALSLFEAHIANIAAAHQRILSRRHVDCACLGADEAMMADMVAAAADDDRQRAYALAARYVRHDAMFEIVEGAAQLGRLLRRIGDAPEPCDATDPPQSARPSIRRRGRTLH